VIRIGLTGSLGAGKSTVGQLFEQWGAARVDADLLAREAVEPGTEGLASVSREFGAEVIASDGSLDRRALRGIVFADAEARARLESIVHPAVDRLREQRMRQAEEDGFEVAVLEIPLLFEKDLRAEFDSVVTVDAPPSIRSARVVSSRGISADEFLAMEAAQWPAGRKRTAADQVIWNPGDREALELDARRVWNAVTAMPSASEPEAAIRSADGSGVWQIDLHMHTSASKDSLSDPASVVDAARAAGLDRIAITDHDEIDGAFAARDLAPDLVIVGEEVRTSEGLDLIGLYLRAHIAPGSSFRETSSAIRSQGGVVYLPHPFDSHRGTDEDFLATVEDCVDAVEGINARIHDSARNEHARTWATERDLPLGAGSDAHMVSEIGRARAFVRPFDGPGELLAALESGRISGNPSSHLVHLGSTWAKIWKRIRGAG
jgi:dephospho-CoA kinase